MLMACSKKEQALTIVVTNDLDFTRMNEMVELPVEQLGQDVEGYILTDASGEQIDYQIVEQGEQGVPTLIFLATVPASGSIELTWRKAASDEEVKQPVQRVYARYVPERKDDFAWENDRAAYRMYGPALADENPSNGVDLWLKGTDSLIIDKFYAEAQTDELFYHRLHDIGLDCYKVGDKLGCGGIAPLYDGKLWVNGHYDRWQLIEQGPLRTIFALEYDNIGMAGRTFKERIVITVDAGSIVNKAEVTYEGDDVPDMRVAGGIYLHDSIDNIMFNPAEGWIAYAEDGITQTPDPVPAGRYFTAVIMPQGDQVGQLQNTEVISRPYQVGETFTYYFGGGWNRMVAAGDQVWSELVSQKARAIASPLKVGVR